MKKIGEGTPHLVDMMLKLDELIDGHNELLERIKLLEDEHKTKYQWE